MLTKNVASKAFFLKINRFFAKLIFASTIVANFLIAIIVKIFLNLNLSVILFDTCSIVALILLLKLSCNASNI